MKIGLVDIGSNTIRIVVYDIDESNKYKEVLNERYFAGLVEHVDNNKIDEEGICKLIGVLSGIKELCALVGCNDIRLFATASLRGVENIALVLNRVKEDTNFDIDVISGEEEVYYDYKGIINSGLDNKGVGIDLGGGSCQIFVYDEAGIKASDSFRIGCLVMYKNYVKGLLPTKKEIKKIEEYVKEELKTNKALKNVGYDTLYAMGGSVRATAKLHRALVGGDDEISKYQLKLKQLEEIIETIYNMDISGVRLICHIIPERVYTIMPAMITLRTICKYLGVNKIKIASNSVREGYLCERVLKENCTSTES